MLHSRYASPYLEVLSATQLTVGFCFYILNIGEIVLETLFFNPSNHESTHELANHACHVLL
jgi:hypothetical protein